MLLAEFKEFYSKWETEAGLSPTVTLCFLCGLFVNNTKYNERERSSHKIRLSSYDLYGPFGLFMSLIACIATFAAHANENSMSA